MAKRRSAGGSTFDRAASRVSCTGRTHKIVALRLLNRNGKGHKEATKRNCVKRPRILQYLHRTEIGVRFSTPTGGRGHPWGLLCDRSSACLLHCGLCGAMEWPCRAKVCPSYGAFLPPDAAQQRHFAKKKTRFSVRVRRARCAGVQLCIWAT